MSRILFVDHDYHLKTRSSDFFVAILSERHEVDHRFVDPGSLGEASTRESLLSDLDDFDLVYIWQLDFLAPLFLARGKPVMCSPMYDGSNGLPAEHWALLRDVGFVNFSFALHEISRSHGPRSLYVKYFPEPREPRDPLPFEDGLRAFFWRRRPEHGLDIGLIDRIFGSQFESLHLHDAPDIPELDAAQTPDLSKMQFPVTRSTWFEDRAEMEEVLAGCNVYIAPRLTEGIGMGFLEAMARGMLVAANDAPTHNEYIVSGLNGVLFDRQSQDVGQLPDAGRIARMGHRSVVLGRQAWLETREIILDFVAERLDPPRGAARPCLPISAGQADALVSAYLEGLPAYRERLKSTLQSPDLAPARRGRPRNRILVGNGFHRIEGPSERFFPVRYVWTAQQSITLVPIKLEEDLALVFREGRGRDIDDETAGGFRAMQQGQPVPLRIEPSGEKGFFSIVLPKDQLRPYESLRIESPLPLFSPRPNTRQRGLLMLEVGLEFVTV